MDIQKLIAYWQSGSREDIAAARSLLLKRHVRHALFFAELAVEKMLKAHVVRVTQAIPPKTHDLPRLADLAQLSLSEEQRGFLARVQEHCLAGRYPEFLPPPPSRKEAEEVIQECQKALSWLTRLFEKPSSTT